MRDIIDKKHKYYIEDKILIIPHIQAESIKVYNYWQTLIDSDRLKYRLCDTVLPDISDVYDIFNNPLNQVYYIYDIDSNKYIAEYMLNNFQAKTCQIHFSFLPIHPLRSIRIGKNVTDFLLELGIIDSLFGVTPVSNKLACRFIERVGFEHQFVLRSGCKYFGSIDDALISVKQENL